MKRLFTDNFYELSEKDKDYLRNELSWSTDTDDQQFTDDDLAEQFCSDLELERDYMDQVLDRIDTLHIHNDLIAIADLGLWDGRRTGYKELDNLTDIYTCMSDYNTIYVERNDLKIRAIHHDGTNYVTIREFKDISDEQKNRFMDKIYYGSVTQRDISRYTKAIGKTVYNNYHL